MPNPQGGDLSTQAAPLLVQFLPLVLFIVCDLRDICQMLVHSQGRFTKQVRPPRDLLLINPAQVLPGMPTLTTHTPLIKEVEVHPLN